MERYNGRRTKKKSSLTEDEYSNYEEMKRKENLFLTEHNDSKIKELKPQVINLVMKKGTFKKDHWKLMFNSDDKSKSYMASVKKLTDGSDSLILGRVDILPKDYNILKGQVVIVYDNKNGLDIKTGFSTNVPIINHIADFNTVSVNLSTPSDKSFFYHKLLDDIVERYN